MKQKIIVKTVFYGLLILVITLGYSCKKKDPQPDARTIQLSKISTTWNINKVVNDDLDVTDQYSGFTLTVNQLNYTTQNGGNPWPSSGTYDFKDGDLTTIIRNDGTEIKIEELTTSSLILSFNYASLSGGRTAGITGDFTFSLTK